MKTLIITNYQSNLVEHILNNLDSDDILLHSVDIKYNTKENSKVKLIEKIENHNDTYENVIVDLRYNEQEDLEKIVDSPDINNRDGLFSNTVTDNVLFVMKTIKGLILDNIKSGKGKYFFLLQDDSFGYLDSCYSSPVYNETITAMSKSLAKEYSRYNMFFNTLVIQPELKELKLDRNSKEVLKNYALKYKTINYEDVTKFLISMIQNEFPLSGATIRLGNGVVDYV
ncbi:hypothetical protein CKY10_13115 [Photorhabdus sp. HUG-39]|uniref:SDR family oxidoreductase n=1 Tax=Photorhabdus kayaii TaxID=230088 RepID=A0ABX0AZ15_9GAMM|nr:MULTISPECIES: hypothetical protein [Photorhabdus]MCC8374082.1 hypothetical protein [Photorhabdus bodei]MDB6369001.1 hypothetical protein [Photorhabdus bodei]NDL12549.1 hypothetical protein [Photorhabdus kayaii]NDL26090.1 hypothetical protein [Photorhabdus kayaii]RAX08986.1 hypothetical protein CKY10_13115 [Photorhabdus sp. HUG-39]